MYRIEGGQVPLRTLDVEQMCRLYGATPDLTEALVGLAREAKSDGWWQAYGDAIPRWFELYVGLESAASQIRHYATGLVPGLLQTEAYATAVFRTLPGCTESEVARKVAARMERQRLLRRVRPRAPELEVVLDESVLRRPMSDPDEWRRQLAHLSNVTRAENVEIWVLPASVGPHRAWGTGDFVILDFPAIRTRIPEPTTIYSENLTGGLYLEKPGEVAEYGDVWDELKKLALDTRQSLDLIAEIIKETYDD